MAIQVALRVVFDLFLSSSSAKVLQRGNSRGAWKDGNLDGSFRGPGTTSTILHGSVKLNTSTHSITFSELSQKYMLSKFMPLQLLKAHAEPMLLSALLVPIALRQKVMLTEYLLTTVRRLSYQKKPMRNILATEAVRILT